MIFNLLLYLFSLKVIINELTYDWQTFTHFLLNGETLLIKVISEKPISYFYDEGEIIEKSREDSLREIFYIFNTQNSYTKLIITNGKKEIKINFLRLIPYRNEKRIGDFYIGRYPRRSPHPNLKNVKGFIKVSSEIKDLYLSPDYQLKDFIPQRLPYISLREELIYKIQLFSDYLKKKGINLTKFKIFSAYRTPRGSNRGGGRVSAHIYGGACDIGLDLNGDKKISLKENKVLYNYACEFEDSLKEKMPKLIGGLGYYRRKRFIHIDIRGEKMRWAR